MAHLIDLKTIIDSSGSLTVIDKSLPFEIKRVFYIYSVKGKRGGHKHKKTIQGMVCLTGSCEILVESNQMKETFLLNSPNKCLILNPEDWHEMNHFSEGTILLVLSSEYFDPQDYINEK